MRVMPRLLNSTGIKDVRRVLLLASHYDDAVLSAGCFMAGRPDCHVVTVFAGMPKDEEMLTEYDKNCGFESAAQALNVRKDENNEALAFLSATSESLDLVDNGYGEPFNESALLRKVGALMLNPNFELILAPIGISHPDHERLGDAVAKLAPTTRTPVYLWEDLPDRVTWPERVVERMGVLPKMALDFLGDGSMVAKIRALTCYRSQIGLINTYNTFVPERFWRLEKPPVEEMRA